MATARKDTLGKSLFSFLILISWEFLQHMSLPAPASTISHLHGPSAPPCCGVGGAGWGGSWREDGLSQGKLECCRYCGDCSFRKQTFQSKGKSGLSVDIFIFM